MYPFMAKNREIDYLFTNVYLYSHGKITVIYSPVTNIIDMEHPP